MSKLSIADRIKNVLKEKKASITSIARTDTERVNITRQLNGQVKVSMETINRVLECFPDVSAEFLLRGEGGWERKTHIVTTTKQDIHVTGGSAAISQSGEAKVEAPKEQTPSEPDIAAMIRNNDLGGLVAIIMQQKDEIIRLKEQRIRDLEQSVRIADNQLFPDVK